mmetsp:Transcript_9502/g.25027  ORF Transcript_9502/g.25027 Transcript_9502/m.25027 type:complete len:248 (-) Transcript_9502:213-956(-)
MQHAPESAGHDPDIRAVAGPCDAPERTYLWHAPWHAQHGCWHVTLYGAGVQARCPRGHRHWPGWLAARRPGMRSVIVVVRDHSPPLGRASGRGGGGRRVGVHLHRVRAIRGLVAHALRRCALVVVVVAVVVVIHLGLVVVQRDIGDLARALARANLRCRPHPRAPAPARRPVEEPCEPELLGKRVGQRRQVVHLVKVEGRVIVLVEECQLLRRARRRLGRLGRREHHARAPRSAPGPQRCTREWPAV